MIAQQFRRGVTARSWEDHLNIRASAFLLSAGLLLAIAGSAGATPTAAQQSAIRSACPSDFRSYCSGVSPGGAAALQCLQKNLAKLSGACQSAVAAVTPGTSSSSSGNAATSNDAATTDSSVKTDSSDGSSSDSDSGAAATAPEPDSQQKPASQPAAAEPTVHLTRRQEIFLVREACGPEFRAYCGGVQLGGGNALACLRAHANKLSGACKGAISDLMR